jgi:hypothetical protein
MDMFFLLGTTITKPDRIEGLLTRLAKLYAARMVFIEKNARR